MSPAVLQLVDTLDAGGAERVAVQLANSLQEAGYRSLLGTTRREGALAEAVADGVGRLRLARTSRWDAAALFRLRSYLREEAVDVVHAHSTSLFLAALATPRRERARLVWHDHFGRHEEEERPAWLYRPAARRAHGVIAVHPALADWSRRRLGLRVDRVWTVPNFVPLSSAGNGRPSDLPGEPGRRIVCVANLRPQKDHPLLLEAMARVVTREPSSHLLLVGADPDRAYRRRLEAVARRLAIERHVTFLGQRSDVVELLAACDVAVLPSRSEGMPLVLLEYGAARLATVATDVGGARPVLDGGCGRLVPPGDAERLAEAIVSLLSSETERRTLAARLHARIVDRYSPAAVMPQIHDIYRTILADPR